MPIVSKQNIVVMRKRPSSCIVEDIESLRRCWNEYSPAHDGIPSIEYRITSHESLPMLPMIVPSVNNSEVTTPTLLRVFRESAKLASEASNIAHIGKVRCWEHTSDDIFPTEYYKTNIFRCEEIDCFRCNDPSRVSCNHLSRVYNSLGALYPSSGSSISMRSSSHSSSSSQSCQSSHSGVCPVYLIYGLNCPVVKTRSYLDIGKFMESNGRTTRRRINSS